MRLCAECTKNSDAWSHETAPPGRCSECGRAFDVQGMPVQDDSVTCPIHEPILASCPHEAAQAGEVPTPAASWLVDGSGTTAGGRPDVSGREVR